MVINANYYVNAAESTLTIKGGNAGTSGGTAGANGGGGSGGSGNGGSGGNVGNGGDARLDIYGYMHVDTTVIANGNSGEAVLQVHSGIHRSIHFTGTSGTFQIDAGGIAILGLDENSWDTNAPGANYQVSTYGWVNHQLTVAGKPQTLANNGVLAWMDYAPSGSVGGETLALQNVSFGVGTTATAPGTGGGFGSDSLTVVNSPGFVITGNAAITYNSGSNSPFVDATALLLVVVDQNIKTGDSFIVMQNTAGNFDLTSGLGWTNPDNAFTTSRLLSVSVAADNDNLVATFDKKNPVQELPGLSDSVGGLLTAMTDQVGHSNGWNPAPNIQSSIHSGVHFVSRIADTQYMPDAELGARTLEGSVRMASVAGSQAAVMSAHITSAKTVHMRATDLAPGLSGSSFLANFDNGINYLSADGSKKSSMPQYVNLMLTSYENTANAQKKALAANAADGGVTMGRGYNSGFGLWAMPVYQNTSVKNLTAGNFETGFNGHFYGLVFGGDYTSNTANKFRIGVSFDFGTGKVDSNGSFLDTESDFDYWGASLYGGYNIGNFLLSADFGYNRTKNKITQTPPASMLFPELHAKVNSDIWSLGAKIQYKFITDMVDITPYASARFMSLKTGDHDVLVNTYYSPGSTGVVFSVKDDTQNIWRFPVGVQLSKDFNVSKGVMLAPSIDVGAVFAAGDLDAKSVTRIPGVNAVSVTTTDDVLDKVTFNAKAGLEIFTDSGLSFGLGYNLQASEHRTGHTLFGTIRFEF